MKRLVLVGALVGAFAASGAAAQTPGSQTTPDKPAGRAGGKASGGQSAAGHTAPKQQPPTEAASNAPEGQVALGSVHIPKAVKADGKPLPAGTYQVRLKNDTAGAMPKAASQMIP